MLLNIYITNIIRLFHNNICHNSSVRIVTNTPKYDHITTLLKKLHWLPVRDFKSLLITYKSINDMALEYLCELVSIRKSFRKFMSSSQILLQAPVSRLKLYVDCALSVAYPLPVCGIGCRQILEMRRLLNFFNLF